LFRLEPLQLRPGRLVLPFQLLGPGPLLRRPRLLRQPRLHHRGVGGEPFDQVQPEQRLDRRPQRRAAAGVLRQRPDLLAVEEEQLRDLQRNQLLDDLRPVARQCGAVQLVLVDAERLAELAVLGLPCAAHLVAVVLAVGGVTEGEGDADPFGFGDAVVNGLAEEVIVGEAAALGAAGAGPVQGELDGVEQGGLAAAVDAAEEDDGQVFAAAACGGEVEDLPAAVQAEVAHGQLFEDHP
jgi:hypothetical protein